MPNRLSMRLFIPCMILACALIGSSCRQTFTSPYGVHGLRVDREIFHVNAFKLTDSTVQLSFVSPANLRTKEPTIRYVDVIIGATENSMVDTVSFSVMHEGNVSGDGAQAIGTGFWQTAAAKASSSAVADVTVLTASDHLIFRQIITYSQAEPLIITPFSATTADATVDLGAIVKRVYIPVDEYLPSSENFRVVISDAKGSVMWRSDAGLSFLSVVGNVEPRQANQVQRYALSWNGRDLQQNEVPEGTYNVEFIIPARPKPYTARTSVHWPPR